MLWTLLVPKSKNFNHLVLHCFEPLEHISVVFTKWKEARLMKNSSLKLRSNWLLWIDSIHIKSAWLEPRCPWKLLILSSDTTLSTLQYFTFWINFLDMFWWLKLNGISYTWSMDIGAIVKKYLRIWINISALKKLLENGIYNSGFNRSFVFNRQYKNRSFFTLFHLIIIIQQN